MLCKTFLLLVFCFIFSSTLFADKPETFISPFGSVCKSEWFEHDYGHTKTIPSWLRGILRPENRLFRYASYPPVMTVYNHLANVTSLSLGSVEIVANSGNEKIDVVTEYIDSEYDVVTFNYQVSGGKIVGNGAKVTWDLTGAPPGTYTIMAGVNDGLGVCGEIKIRRFEILECAGCMLRETE